MTSHLHLREPASRLLSLDVVRGITIAFMIMVNNNGLGCLSTPMGDAELDRIGGALERALSTLAKE